MGRIISPNVINDGLIFCMDFANKRCYNGDGSGGTIANDLVGYTGFNGEFKNTSTSFDNSNAGFVTFDGTNDYIQTNFDVFPLPPFTVEIWFKTTNVNQIGGLFSNRIGLSNSYRHFDIFIASDQYGNFSGNKLGCYHGGALGSRVGNISTTNVCDGNWHQGIVTSNIINNSIYIDTAFEDQSSDAQITIGNADYKIGALGDGSSFINPFDGSISNVKYYNKVLSADEISQNYNALKDRFI
tara:strand:- start:126 stop:848 length:723 start_codon:yes stop_codon:yes gene_type:complete